ncbi:MAG: hypothetical protein WDN48_02535 [Pseudolabrys sp.]
MAAVLLDDDDLRVVMAPVAAMPHLAMHAATVIRFDHNRLGASGGDRNGNADRAQSRAGNKNRTHGFPPNGNDSPMKGNERAHAPFQLFF